MCFAISSNSFVSVLISPVYCFLLGLTPERQKQQFQVQLTSPLCVSFLIKFPVTLPPFPPTSVVRQIIKSCIIFTWGCPKAVFTCLGYVDKNTGKNKTFRGAKAKHRVVWQAGHTCEDTVTLWWGQLWREVLVLRAAAAQWVPRMWFHAQALWLSSDFSVSKHKLILRDDAKGSF